MVARAVAVGDRADRARTAPAARRKATRVGQAAHHVEEVARTARPAARHCGSARSRVASPTRAPKTGISGRVASTISRAQQVLGGDRDDGQRRQHAASTSAGQVAGQVGLGGASHRGSRRTASSPVAAAAGASASRRTAREQPAAYVGADDAGRARGQTSDASPTRSADGRERPRPPPAAQRPRRRRRRRRRRPGRRRARPGRSRAGCRRRRRPAPRPAGAAPGASCRTEPRDPVGLILRRRRLRRRQPASGRSGMWCAAIRLRNTQ